MTKYAEFRDLKSQDKKRIKDKKIYPHRRKGHGVNMFLYPVDDKGNLLNLLRKHK